MSQTLAGALLQLAQSQGLNLGTALQIHREFEAAISARGTQAKEARFLSDTNLSAEPRSEGEIRLIKSQN